MRTCRMCRSLVRLTQSRESVRSLCGSLSSATRQNVQRYKRLPYRPFACQSGSMSKIHLASHHIYELKDSYNLQSTTHKVIAKTLFRSPTTPPCALDHQLHLHTSSLCRHLEISNGLTHVTRSTITVLNGSHNSTAEFGVTCLGSVGMSLKHLQIVRQAPEDVARTEPEIRWGEPVNACRKLSLQSGFTESTPLHVIVGLFGFQVSHILPFVK